VLFYCNSTSKIHALSCKYRGGVPKARPSSSPARGRDYRLVPGTSLKVGDVVLVEAGDNIPSDGDVIESVASVNEAAITGVCGANTIAEVDDHVPAV
jgi:K+-transporting ATPase ATPase B chain